MCAAQIKASAGDPPAARSPMASASGPKHDNEITAREVVAQFPLVEHGEAAARARETEQKRDLVREHTRRHRHGKFSSVLGELPPVAGRIRFTSCTSPTRTMSPKNHSAWSAAIGSMRNARRAGR